jgi:nitroimidazol reductase NimA-like FMN-containing flavoprotein (pyridoxamine 5'-phosphate oxidase superfamily)
MSAAEIDDFILVQKVGRVGCHVGGVTYVVPVIFAWGTDGFYIYTTEGQKVSMMRENSSVCFEIDEYLIDGSWSSVIIQGVYEELHDDDALQAKQILTERLFSTTGAARESGDRGEGRVPVAFRIRPLEVTGRKVDRSA